MFFPLQIKKKLTPTLLNGLHVGDFWMNMQAGKWYPDHILSWYPYRDNKNVYFICFEDMKSVSFRCGIFKIKTTM